MYQLIFEDDTYTRVTVSVSPVRIADWINFLKSMNYLLIKMEISDD